MKATDKFGNAINPKCALSNSQAKACVTLGLVVFVFTVKFVYFYFVAFLAHAIVGFVLFFRDLSATS